MSMRLAGALILGLWVAGCGGSDGAAGGSQPESALVVTMMGTYDTYPHADEYSGQTAKHVTAGVRSLELIDTENGVWPLMDAAPGNMSVSYSSGSPSVLVSIAPEQVRAGHYTKARLVQDWSRFEITATLHESPLNVAGTLTVLQATSEGAIVEGETFEQGQYAHTFTGSGVERSYEGTALIPDHSTTAEAEAIDEDGEWAVYFPLDLAIPPETKGTLRIDVNLDRAFRWSDLPGDGYVEGLYDMTPPVYEPVEQFGGNRFVVRLE